MNQVLQDTIAARDLLATQGWIPGLLRNGDTGAHCAVGAVLDTVMPDGVCDTGFLANGYSIWIDPRSPRVKDVLNELVRSIPGVMVAADWVINWRMVVLYNNSMGEQVVMDMFNTTIARLKKIEAKELAEESVSA